MIFHANVLCRTSHFQVGWTADPNKVVKFSRYFELGLEIYPQNNKTSKLTCVPFTNSDIKLENITQFGDVLLINDIATFFRLHDRKHLAGKG